MNPLNKKHWSQFVSRCKAASVTEVHLAREDAGGTLRWKYNARDHKSGQVWNGVWEIDRRNLSPEDLAQREKEFQDLVAAANFSVARHETGAGEGKKAASARLKEVAPPQAGAPLAPQGGPGPARAKDAGSGAR